MNIHVDQFAPEGFSSIKAFLQAAEIPEDKKLAEITAITLRCLSAPFSFATNSRDVLIAKSKLVELCLDKYSEVFSSFQHRVYGLTQVMETLAPLYAQGGRHVSKFLHKEKFLLAAGEVFLKKDEPFDADRVDQVLKGLSEIISLPDHDRKYDQEIGSYLSGERAPAIKLIPLIVDKLIKNNKDGVVTYCLANQYCRLASRDDAIELHPSNQAMLQHLQEKFEAIFPDSSMQREIEEEGVADIVLTENDSMSEFDDRWTDLLHCCCIALSTVELHLEIWLKIISNALSTLSYSPENSTEEQVEEIQKVVQELSNVINRAIDIGSASCQSLAVKIACTTINKSLVPATSEINVKTGTGRENRWKQYRINIIENLSWGFKKFFSKHASSKLPLGQSISSITSRHSDELAEIVGCVVQFIEQYLFCADTSLDPDHNFNETRTYALICLQYIWQDPSGSEDLKKRARICSMNIYKSLHHADLTKLIENKDVMVVKLLENCVLSTDDDVQWLAILCCCHIVLSNETQSSLSLMKTLEAVLPNLSECLLLDSKLACETMQIATRQLSRILEHVMDAKQDSRAEQRRAIAVVLACITIEKFSKPPHDIDIRSLSAGFRTFLSLSNNTFMNAPDLLERIVQSVLTLISAYVIDEDGCVSVNDANAETLDYMLICLKYIAKNVDSTNDHKKQAMDMSINIYEALSDASLTELVADKKTHPDAYTGFGKFMVVIASMRHGSLNDNMKQAFLDALSKDEPWVTRILPLLFDALSLCPDTTIAELLSAIIRTLPIQKDSGSLSSRSGKTGTIKIEKICIPEFFDMCRKMLTSSEVENREELACWLIGLHDSEKNKTPNIHVLSYAATLVPIISSQYEELLVLQERAIEILIEICSMYLRPLPEMPLIQHPDTELTALCLGLQKIIEKYALLENCQNYSEVKAAMILLYDIDTRFDVANEAREYIERGLQCANFVTASYNTNITQSEQLRIIKRARELQHTTLRQGRMQFRTNIRSLYNICTTSLMSKKQDEVGLNEMVNTVIHIFQTYFTQLSSSITQCANSEKIHEFAIYSFDVLRDNIPALYLSIDHVLQSLVAKCKGIYHDIAQRARIQLLCQPVERITGKEQEAKIINTLKELQAILNEFKSSYADLEHIYRYLSDITHGLVSVSQQLILSSIHAEVVQCLIKLYVAYRPHRGQSGIDERESAITALLNELSQSQIDPNFIGEEVSFTTIKTWAMICIDRKSHPLWKESAERVLLQIFSAWKESKEICKQSDIVLKVCASDNPFIKLPKTIYAALLDALRNVVALTDTIENMTTQLSLCDCLEKYYCRTSEQYNQAIIIDMILDINPTKFSPIAYQKLMELLLKIINNAQSQSSEHANLQRLSAIAKILDCTMNCYCASQFKIIAQMMQHLTAEQIQKQVVPYLDHICRCLSQDIKSQDNDRVEIVVGAIEDFFKQYGSLKKCGDSVVQGNRAILVQALIEYIKSAYNSERLKQRCFSQIFSILSDWPVTINKYMCIHTCIINGMVGEDFESFISRWSLETTSEALQKAQILIILDIIEGSLLDVEKRSFISMICKKDLDSKTLIDYFRLRYNKESLIATDNSTLLGEALIEMYNNYDLNSGNYDKLKQRSTVICQYACSLLPSPPSGKPEFHGSRGQQDADVVQLERQMRTCFSDDDENPEQAVSSVIQAYFSIKGQRPTQAAFANLGKEDREAFIMDITQQISNAVEQDDIRSFALRCIDWHDVSNSISWKCFWQILEKNQNEVIARRSAELFYTKSDMVSWQSTPLSERSDYENFAKLLGIVQKYKRQ